MSLLFTPIFLLQPTPSLFRLQSDIGAQSPQQSGCCQWHFSPLLCSLISILVFGWFPLPPSQQSDKFLPPSQPSAQTPPISGFSNLLHWENRSHCAWTVPWSLFSLPHLASHLPPHINHSPPFFSFWSKWVPPLLQDWPLGWCWDGTSASHHPCSLIISPMSLSLARPMSSGKNHTPVFPIPTQLCSRKTTNPETYFLHLDICPHLHLSALFPSCPGLTESLLHSCPFHLPCVPVILLAWRLPNPQLQSALLFVLLKGRTVSPEVAFSSRNNSESCGCAFLSSHIKKVKRAGGINFNILFNPISNKLFQHVINIINELFYIVFKIIFTRISKSGVCFPVVAPLHWTGHGSSTQWLPYWAVKL